MGRSDCSMLSVAVTALTLSRLNKTQAAVQLLRFHTNTLGLAHCLFLLTQNSLIQDAAPACIFSFSTYLLPPSGSVAKLVGSYVSL